jgi:hypothetical protein
MPYDWNDIPSLLASLCLIAASIELIGQYLACAKILSFFGVSRQTPHLHIVLFCSFGKYNQLKRFI